MMTGHDMQNEVYSLIRNSALAEAVSGGVYKNGYRPRDSRLEDIVVTFTTATGNQIQDGIVTVNIYVPDIDPYANGVLVEDGARTSALEDECVEWLADVDRSQSQLLMELQQAVYTMADEPISQHYVVMRLRVRYLNN